MAWEVDIVDVVGNQVIQTSWGNPVRDRVVHPMALFDDLPTSGIADGSVAYAADKAKFYGRVANLWKEFATQDSPWTVGAIASTKLNGAVFQHEDGTQFIQIGTLRQIQAFSAAAAAELFLNPLGGAVGFGAAGIMKIDPTNVRVQFGANDWIRFDEATNEYELITDAVTGHLKVNQVHASGSVTCVGLAAGGGAISGAAAITGTSLTVGAGAITGGTITASTKFVTGATDFDEGLVKRNSGGSLSVHCAGNDIILGVGNARTLFVKNNLTGADLMTLQLSGARVAAKYPSGLPELGGMLDVGIVASSWQLGIPTSQLAFKQNVSAVGRSRVAELSPCIYEWRKTGQQAQGFIVEELAKVSPLLVRCNEEGTPIQIDRDAILAELVKAVQELQER